MQLKMKDPRGNVINLRIHKLENKTEKAEENT